MKKRPLTYVGAFLLLIVAFLVTRSNFKKPQTITTKLQPVTTHVAAKPKIKIKDQEHAPASSISPEVQRRLAAAGFKTDSFIAVQTKKNEN